MSPTIAIVAVAALFVVLLAPLAIAAWRGAGTMPLVAVYTVLLSLLAGYHSGLLSPVNLPDLSGAEVTSSTPGDAQCVEVLSLVKRAGAVVDYSDPPRLVVARDRWTQLPEPAQQAVVECVQRTWPTNAEPAQVDAR